MQSKTSKNLQPGGIDKVFCGFATRNLLILTPIKHDRPVFVPVSGEDSHQKDNFESDERHCFLFFRAIPDAGLLTALPAWHARSGNV
ncbi:hypothetical protein THS27_01420 [Thalassospira sp. MCCC 1A01428]|nr:hypothetical protein THS27_01420 [Thalassospira sp. MCCC 1A01428]